ncbi:MAG: hypothetical protein AAGE05_08615 [Pseudomonadota bacterium]
MFRIVIAATTVILTACSGGSEPETAPEDTAPATVETDAAAEPETIAAIPEAFHGRWDFSEETCGDPASEMRLDIAADRIVYYESAAIPQTITQTAPSAVTVIHRFSGEGEEWEETLAYELSEDGDRLTVNTPDGSLSIRMRCPA